MRAGGFNMMPPVVKNLLIINAIFFLATILLKPKGIDLVSVFGMHMIGSPVFKPWQIITYMFMHETFGHIFFNMFALWMFGSAIENALGSKKFLIYYLITGMGAAVLHYFVLYVQLYPVLASLNRHVVIGASGSVFGLLLAFGMMFPNNHIYLYFLLPIKAKWFVIIYGAIELIYGISGTADGVAHFAHLGGMLFGLPMLLYWRKKGGEPFFRFSNPFKSNFFKRRKKDRHYQKKYATSYENYVQRPLSDEEYNARKVQEQQYLDQILDKISKNGYESLTKAERDFLFYYGKK